MAPNVHTTRNMAVEADAMSWGDEQAASARRGGDKEEEAMRDDTYRRRWWILVVLSVSLLIIGIDDTIINIAVPTLQRELGASASALQWKIGRASCRERV